MPNTDPNRPTERPQPAPSQLLRTLVEHALVAVCVIGLGALYALIFLALDWTGTNWMP